MKLSLLVFSLLIGQSLAYLASFYGNSFIFNSISSSTDSISTNIVIRFQTKSPDGALLIAFGRHDSLIVQLKNAKIQLIISRKGSLTLLESPSDLTFNDLLWHEVKVIRDGHSVTMVINGQHIISDVINNKRLNFQYGVLLGGLADSENVTYPFPTNSVHAYRGCLLHAEVNSNNVLDPLSDVDGRKVVYNVRNGCSEEFRAGRSETIAFDSTNSFVSMRKWSLQEEAVFQCQIKTKAETGVVLYNAGKGRGHFVGLELVGGALRAAVNKGGGVVGLHTPITINDGIWHSIKFTFSQSYLEIAIDANRTKAFVEAIEPTRHKLRLDGALFVGGIDPVTSKRAKRSLISITSSNERSAALFGCMRNIRVNSKRKGLEDALVTNDISIGCALTNQKQSKDTTGPLAANQKVSEIIMLENNLDVMDTEIESHKSVEFVLPAFGIDMQPLLVKEGSSEAISIGNINMSVVQLLSFQSVFPEFNKSDVILNVKKPPKHGALIRSGNCEGFRKFEITLDEVKNSQMHFCHDGSEVGMDAINFEILWNISHLDKWDRAFILSQSGLDSNQPIKLIPLNNGTRYTLTFMITPVDDPPMLKVPLEYLYQPISNAKTPLPINILKADDIDSPPSEILYTILARGPNYFIEHIDEVGMPVYAFLQLDISELYFVHTGAAVNSRMVFRLSSLSNITHLEARSTDTVIMRFATTPFKISASISPNVSIVQGSSFLLTDQLIHVNSSANGAIVPMTVKVALPLSYGQIEIFSNESWMAVNEFSVSGLSSGSIRYDNTYVQNDLPSGAMERLTFTISGAGVTSDEYTLPISIQKVVVEVHVPPVVMNGRLQKAIQVEVKRENVHSTETQIQLMLPETSNMFDIIYHDTGLVITPDLRFTLSDVKLGRIHVKVSADFATQRVSDVLHFTAHLPGGFASPIADLNVTYIPDLKTIHVSNTGLSVVEGGSATIVTDILHSYFIQSPNQPTAPKHFVYRVTRQPLYGVLQLASNASAQVTSFTSIDIENGELMYIHDDSETSHDNFTVDIRALLDGEVEDIQSSYERANASADVNIHVDLVNDNRPVRVVDKQFEIARLNERLLTRNDIWYHDDDVDFDDLNLKYIRRGIINGEILNATDHKKIFEFTQRQMVNNEVLFQHKKADFGRFVFWVKDDQHSSTGLFVVQASDPSIAIRNNSQLLVTRHSTEVITTQHLCSVANTASLDNLIQYSVTQPPKHGYISLNGTRSILSFTQHDVSSGRLTYTHTGEVMNDLFMFKVTAEAAVATGNVTIQIFLESQQEPPAVMRNKVIVVNQAESVAMKKQIRVVHADSRSSDIKFIIKQYPMLGRLTGPDGKEPKQFTQYELNKGFVVYHQSQPLDDAEVSSDDRIIDELVVDVTNGYTELTNFTITFDIIPKLIPLHVGHLAVDEGRSRAVLPSYLSVRSPHFQDDDMRYRVKGGLAHGYLESLRDRGTPLTTFSKRLVDAEFLYYSHDDSDTLQDFILVQAFIPSRNKSSAVHNFTITITPVNDENPTVVNNTGLDTWTNSITTLTSVHLGATDPDSPPSNLTYSVLPPSNGWLALKSDFEKVILNFTQQHINDGKIVFVHKGADTGGFSFQVNDGENYDTKQIFVVKTQLLVLQVKKNKPITIFPESKMQITSEMFSVVSNDDSSARVIHLKIIEHPSFGGVVKYIDGKYKKVDEFTQADVDNGTIWFLQNKPIKLWTSTDRVIVEASSFPAIPLDHVILSLNITYNAYASAGRTSPAQTNIGLNVTEGENVTMTLHDLDASNLRKMLPADEDEGQYQVRYVITIAPQHGNIFVNDEQSSEFTHQQLSDNDVVYGHDGSEDSKDEFNVEFCLFNATSGEMLKYTRYRDVVHVRVAQVNDNPPLLATKGNVLKVVDGFPKAITPSDLQANDLDNPPHDVLFTLVRPPSRGKLMFSDNSTLNALQFTQHDIEQGRLRYVPNIEDDPLSSKVADAFYFSLTDGVHRPTYSLFQIQIVPVFLTSHPRTVSLEQGDFSIPLTTSVFNTSTNGNLSLVNFTLVEQPPNGVILFRDKELKKFTYDDVLTGEVVYLMINQQVSNDIMGVLVSYSLPNQHAISMIVTIEVKVKPLFTPPDILEVSNDGLTQLHINADDLALKTGSVPRFDVVEPAEFGEILKVDKDECCDVIEMKNTSHNRLNDEAHRITKRDAPSFLKPTSYFTQPELNGGLVFIYVPFVNLTNETYIPDQFTIRLSVASGEVQPAYVNLKFNITDTPAVDYTDFFDTLLQHEDTTSTLDSFESTVAVTDITHPMSHDRRTTNEHMSTTPLGNIDLPDEVTTKENVIDVNEASTNFWLPILLIACGLVLLIIAIVMFIICRRHCRPAKDDFKKVQADETTCEDGADKILISHSGRVTVTAKCKAPYDEAQISPACPGVTVTPLLSSDYPDLADSGAESLYNEDLQSNNQPYSSIACNSRIDETSYEFHPTVYHYEDTGSCDDMLNDPDVMALYSSDESIPSALGMPRDYASTYATGSVPADLDHGGNTVYPSGRVSNGRSTASLPRVPLNAQLTLSSNSTVENHYWV